MKEIEEKNRRSSIRNMIVAQVGIALMRHLMGLTLIEVAQLLCLAGRSVGRSVA